MRYHFDSPAVALSTHASRLLGLPAFLAVAYEAGLDGIDLDLSRGVWVTRADQVATTIEHSGVAARSIWTPRPSRGPLARRRAQETLAAALRLADATLADVLVVDRPSPSDDRTPRMGLVDLVEALKPDLSPATRLAIAIRPEQLEGTREHLAQLHTLRRTAEEWDFDLALDLVGPIDHRWEAEAAVTRVVPRLSLIRLGPFESRPPGRTRAAMTARALAAAADWGFRGVVAVCPTPPIWRIGSVTALARAAAAAGECVRTRFERVHGPLTFDSSPEFRTRF